MDYLQYCLMFLLNSGLMLKVLNLVINGLPSIFLKEDFQLLCIEERFKPCYKWITFNIKDILLFVRFPSKVLNLVINGLPSIYHLFFQMCQLLVQSFKPCYKWITFNILITLCNGLQELQVLNLVINGLPSIFKSTNWKIKHIRKVLNLVINGLPSIYSIPIPVPK